MARMDRKNPQGYKTFFRLANGGCGGEGSYADSSSVGAVYDRALYSTGFDACTPRPRFRRFEK
jgi:hypothetical protein